MRNVVGQGPVYRTIAKRKVGTHVPSRTVPTNIILKVVSRNSKTLGNLLFTSQHLRKRGNAMPRQRER
jgi:hypothetical protein